MSNQSRHVVLLLFMLNTWFVPIGQAQPSNIGIPPILNFPKQTYKAGTQTWDISQGNDGLMWFANNGGLIAFDGSRWQTFPMPNGTIVRSVAANLENKHLYVGGQGDFGYFSPDVAGKMHYYSLKALLPKEERQFEDIWDILCTKKGIYFRSDSQVFRYKDGKITCLLAKGKTLRFMGLLGEDVLLQDKGLALYLVCANQVQPLVSKQPNIGEISAILSYTKDSILLTTIKSGIFSYANGNITRWITAEDDFLKKNIIFCAALLSEKKLAVGTALNGLITIDSTRRVVHHLYKKNGLQNNTILSMAAVNNQGIWLGLDNGIDYVDNNSPFTLFYPDGDLQGTGYTAAIHHDKVYFGTNTGLYSTSWRKYYSPLQGKKFDLVQNSEGQVWSLTHLGTQLLMGHHEGAFSISELVAQKLSAVQGTWKFVQIDSNYSVAGHYKGFSVYRKDQHNWTYLQELNGFQESSRILASNQPGVVWMAHPYRGLYRIDLQLPAMQLRSKKYNGTNGLPSGLGNQLFDLEKKIIFTAENHTYSYNSTKDSFVLNQEFDRFLEKGTSLKYLHQDAFGNIWFETKLETGYLQVEENQLDKKVRKVLLPELVGKLTDGFPFILPIDHQNVFVATEKGFLHFDPSRYQRNTKSFRLLLNEIRLLAHGDSLLFAGYGKTPDQIMLRPAENAVRFGFSSPEYPNSDYTLYSYYLEGSDKNWSKWTKENSISFTNLPPGKYSLHAKAKNQYGIESNEISIAFEIAVPWYASSWAYAAYLLTILALLYTLQKRQKRKFEHEKSSLQQKHLEKESEHLLKAYQSQESINRLQEENLEAEIRHKNQELVSATLHITQKNEMLNTVRIALDKIKSRSLGPNEMQQEIEQVVKMVQNDANLDADWESFVQNFDTVHNDFFKRLKEQFPSLRTNDYKLCAYLRLNLTSKDISKLMNISTRSVETNRYRLRKKLELSNDTNLTEFLINF